MDENKKFFNLHHCIYALLYHLVLITKDRRRCLSAPMLDRVREIAAARCDGWGGTLLEMTGEPDHIHLLIALLPNLELSNFVNNLKTTTSRLVRKEFADHLASVYREPVLWSRSYCIVSGGGAPLSIITQYLEQQERPE